LFAPSDHCRTASARRDPGHTGDMRGALICSRSLGARCGPWPVTSFDSPRKRCPGLFCARNRRGACLRSGNCAVTACWAETGVHTIQERYFGLEGNVEISTSTKLESHPQGGWWVAKAGLDLVAIFLFTLTVAAVERRMGITPSDDRCYSLGAWWRVRLLNDCFCGERCSPALAWRGRFSVISLAAFAPAAAVPAVARYWLQSAAPRPE